ncbi:Clp protease N-terminal domain-containing protein [Ureibacillus thermophilus]|uniref:Clp protease N-terminal domain-containing protein n=1 Tax=Ureibacillus thermophilus TaxID=367743 RepID=UPI00361A5C4A
MINYTLFSDTSKKVLDLATELALHWKHDKVETEDLLLALLNVNEGIASKVLKSLNVNSQMIEHQITELGLIGKNKKPMPSHYSSHAYKLFELAEKEAKRFGQNYIDTEHLLIALVREEVGAGAQILKKLSISLEKIIFQILNLNENCEKESDSNFLLSSLINYLLENHKSVSKDIFKNVKGLKMYYINNKKNIGTVKIINKNTIEENTERKNWKKFFNQQEKIPNREITTLRVNQNTHKKIKALVETVKANSTNSLIELMICEFLKLLTEEEKEKYNDFYKHYIEKEKD